jgi:hypothetical protein
MEDQYREDDEMNPEAQGVYKILDYIKNNILKPGARGLLFGIGHFISYKIIGGYITRKLLN